jgi:hypothetical protein
MRSRQTDIKEYKGNHKIIFLNKVEWWNHEIKWGKKEFLTVLTLKTCDSCH